MKAIVNVDLPGKSAAGVWVRTHASMQSEVVDHNVTGKKVLSLKITMSNGRAVTGELTIGATDAIKDPTVAMRAIAEALLAQADSLDKLTIGVSDDEKAALQSIAEAAK